MSPPETCAWHLALLLPWLIVLGLVGVVGLELPLVLAEGLYASARLGLILGLALVVTPTSAQTDMSGTWSAVFLNSEPEASQATIDRQFFVDLKTEARPVPELDRRSRIVHWRSSSVVARQVRW